MVVKLRQAALNFKNYDNKERIATYVAVAFHNGEFRQVCELRLYMGRSRSASRVYADFWTFGNTFYSSGSGSAGGGGYCKKSAAADEAIRNAGIDLDTHIAGAGKSAIREAMRSIASAIAPHTPHIHLVEA